MKAISALLLPVLAAPVVLSVPSAARAEPEFGVLGLSGDGCSEADAALEAATGRGVRIQLAALSAVATPEAPRQRATCTVRIPVRVPAGFQLGLGRLVARGDADVPAAGNAHAVLRLFPAGESGRAVIRAFAAGDQGGFEAATADAGAVRWLPCGESPTLVAQVDVIARLRSDAVGVSAKLAVGSVELPPLQYKRCDTQDGE